MKLDAVYSATPVPYREALTRQYEYHASRTAGRIPDTLWLLEHPPVITTGIRRDQSVHILADIAALGVEVVETERGGEVTYHGPGQLVGYLFADISGHGFRVRKFVENLEEAFIRYLGDTWGISARHDSEHTGVWVENRKITAIGIALRRRVTLHGFAFNVNTDLSHFDWIVPCGIADPGRGVTSLERLTGRPADIALVARGVAAAVRAALGYTEGEFRQ